MQDWRACSSQAWQPNSEKGRGETTMGRILRFLGLGLVLLIVVGSVLVARILHTAGYFNKVASGFAGKCEQLPGVVGAEDIDLDRATGTVIISSQDRRPLDGPWQQGAIYLAKIDQPGEAPVSAYTAAKFHPHGISLFADAAGRKTLAVINHPVQKESEVLLFDVAAAAPGAAPTLTLRRTIKDALFTDLNDITLVSHEKFYATNDHGSETKLGEQLENWLMLPRANVVYYDGSAAATAATGMSYANGINRNADSTEIYVSETTGRAVQTYRRDPATGVLAHTHSLAIAMGLDNIDVDANGDLWIGAHPRLFDFLGHAQDPKKIAPSAAIKVHLEGDASTFEPVYLNTGEELSGSSVAVAHNGRLLMGGVFDPKYLNCKMAR
jgi:arylesterase/paraoxonase